MFEYGSSMSATAVSLTCSCLRWSHCLVSVRDTSKSKNTLCCHIMSFYLFNVGFWLVHYALLFLPNSNISVLDSEFPVSGILRVVDFYWLCCFTNREGLVWEGSIIYWFCYQTRIWVILMILSYIAHIYPMKGFLKMSFLFKKLEWANLLQFRVNIFLDYF